MSTEVPTPADLALFYRPESMAIVGAHDTRAGLAGFTLQALQVANRVGARFYPINPKLAQVYGIDCLPDVGAVPEPVDVLCIFTGKPIEVLDEAAQVGLKAKFVMVFASGFSELQTPEGPFCADFLICGTGMDMDFGLRPELARCAGNIATWGDRYTPLPE